jgi:hypothetical protein
MITLERAYGFGDGTTDDRPGVDLPQLRFASLTDEKKHGLDPVNAVKHVKDLLRPFTPTDQRAATTLAIATGSAPGAGPGGSTTPPGDPEVINRAISELAAEPSVNSPPKPRRRHHPRRSSRSQYSGLRWRCRDRW